jgi:preprotein translocase subunit SecE
MNFLEFFKISNSWTVSAVVYTILAVAAIVAVRNGALVSRFVGEVKGELRKANWPWESDPKIRGFKKYKELVDSTIVVLIATILLAGFVSMWDFICIYVLNFVTSFGQ